MRVAFDAEAGEETDGGEDGFREAVRGAGGD
jgi:hypothetical protein